MRATSVICTGAIALSGCFAELTTTVVPRQHQTVTARDGTTSELTGVGYTFALWVGVHVDIFGVALNWAPPSTGGRVLRSSDGEGYYDDGHHLRADIDVAMRGDKKVAVTVGGDTIREVGFASALRPPASGYSLFGGVTLATVRRVLSFTLGGSYLATKNAAETDQDKYAPAIDASGVGVMFSVMVAWPRIQDLWYIGEIQRFERELPSIGGKPPSASSSSRSGPCTGGYYGRDSQGRSTWICP